MAQESGNALTVTVVSADRVVWEGEATSIVARTTEGDIGILPGHEPMLAALVPCAVEVLGTNGEREIVAVEGGFISVANNRVSLLSEFARISNEVSASEAEQELAAAQRAIEEGDTSAETLQHRNRAEAQVRAAQKAGGRH